MIVTSVDTGMKVRAHEPDAPGPLDEHFGAGDHSRPILRRSLLIYAVVAFWGLAPSLLDGAAHWQAGGLGLVLPGGGFFAVGGWSFLLVPVTWALFLVALALWLLTANAFAPLLIWGGSAALAAALTQGAVEPSAPYAVVALALLFLAWATWMDKKTAAKELAQRRARNAYLPRAEEEVIARAAAPAPPGTRELSAEDLRALRYALDRGLQPAESLNGFDIIEQFQTSAVRYQLFYLLWSLQIAQAHYAPNFHGYLSEAQRRLIDKITLPVTWRYWIYESLFGNFSLKFDPIAKDNIMLGGFFSANLLLYTAITGDRRYMEPGALTFRLNKRISYPHNVQSILDAGRKNHQGAVYGPLYPCEPKLTYSACNLWGNFAHLVGDRLLGTSTGRDLLPKLKALSVSEMLCRDGTVHSGRVVPLGIRIPVYTCNFVTALWSWMANSFFPDLSRRVWAILRHETIRFDNDGEITLATESYDRMDTGNYKKGDVGVYAQYLIAAREQGDEEVAQAILRKLDRAYGRIERDGTIAYEKASNVCNSQILMGRLMRSGDVRAMILEGPPASALQGPLLSAAAYPNVLVAKAFSHGDDLELVLYPGMGPSQESLAFTRLTPSRPYCARVGDCEMEIVADAKGEATFDVELAGRTEIKIFPKG